MRTPLVIFAAAALLAACAPTGVTETGELAPIYPDYTDITIPANIAPLNFLLNDGASRVCVTIDGKTYSNRRGGDARFSEKAWRSLLAANEGRALEVKVCSKGRDGWKQYAPFTWTVSPDKVDPYLTYRLIEPDYEAYNNIVLQQRCVENFDIDDFSDNRVIGNKCMNCHTYAGQDPAASMFYVRGPGGGAILNMDGQLQKLSIKGEDMISGSVYFGFSPSRRYIVFSANKIIPGYHAQSIRRMEVFDTKSDLYVADLQEHKFIRSSTVADPDMLETFPAFSPDGKYIYYCKAPQIDTVTLDNIETQKYSLCRVAFDEETGVIGDEVETIYDAAEKNKSVCHPRVSPDGRFICFSIADYGTFPLWHREADLMMMDLETGRQIPMTEANSDGSESYHSWSSNSRWLVFASKRDDGVYGKPYFCHVDEDGNCSKSFVLPQRYTDYYHNLLKSFNAPELGKGPLPFTTYDVKEALEQEAMTFD